MSFYNYLNTSRYNENNSVCNVYEVNVMVAKPKRSPSEKTMLKPYYMDIYDLSSLFVLEGQGVIPDIFICCFSVLSTMSYRNCKDILLPSLGNRYPNVPILLVGIQSPIQRIDTPSVKFLFNDKGNGVSQETCQQLVKDGKVSKYMHCVSVSSNDDCKHVFDAAVTLSIVTDDAKMSAVTVKKPLGKVKSLTSAYGKRRQKNFLERTTIKTFSFGKNILKKTIELPIQYGIKPIHENITLPIHKNITVPIHRNITKPITSPIHKTITKPLHNRITRPLSNQLSSELKRLISFSSSRWKL